MEPKNSVLTEYFCTDHLKPRLRAHALRGASVTAVAQAAGYVIQTVGTLILARLLTPDDFGMVSMVLSVSLLLQNCGLNGLTEAIIQRESIDHKQISMLFWINVSFSVVLAALFIAAAPVIVWFYKTPDLYPIIYVISSSIVFGGLSTQHLALLKRGMQYGKISSNDVVAGIVSTCIPIGLAWWGCGYWALVAKWVISPLVITIGAWVVCEWRPNLPTRAAGVGSMVRYALHTYGNFTMNYLRRNIDKMLIGRFLGSQALGYYDRAYHLTSMLPTQIISPIYSVAVSTFSRLTDDGERCRRTYLKVLEVLAFIGMPLSAALTLVSKDVILLLLGPRWEEAGRIFIAFGFSIGVMIIYMTHGWLHLSFGRPDRWFRWGVVELIVTTLGFLVGLRFGGVGVAFAFSTSFYVLIIPALWYAGRPIDLSVSSLVSSLWRYFVSALAAGVLCWIAVQSGGLMADVVAQWSILARVVVKFGLCISVYLIFMIAVCGNTKAISQVTSLLGEVIRNRSLGR